MASFCPISANSAIAICKRKLQLIDDCWRRVFYYPGAQFDTSLLIQSFIMIAIQLMLLKVALDHRPGPSSKGGEASTPFVAASQDGWNVQRPYSFWQWRSPKPYVLLFNETFSFRTLYSPSLFVVSTIRIQALTVLCRYWHFLLYLFVTLLAFELLLSPVPSLYATYSTLIGYLGLSIEATLPLPQILSNYRSRSCKGFRLSVLASWIAGDLMKMFWFFTATSEIPWAFKMCGIFQMCCDLFLGFQYAIYGDGPGEVGRKEHVEMSGLVARSRGVSRVRTPVGEKDLRLG